MPEKLDRCVKDVKGQGKSDDSAWAICTDSLKESEDRIKSQVASTMAERGMVKEHHNPLDIPFGREVPETVSVPGSASAVSIGAKRKPDALNSENMRDTKKQLHKISENVLKQILEIQLGECSCKNHNRPKA